MSAPVAVFLLTAAAVLCMHLSYQLPFYRAISRLETALRRQGIQWSYWRDLRLRLRFHSDPSAIYSETDTAEIRTMKDDVVERRKAIFASLPKLIRIAVIGLGLTAVGGLVELALKKK